VTEKAAEIPAAAELSGGTSPICALKTPYHHPFRRARAVTDTHKGRTIMLGLIGMIIAGAIIGALARLIMRGHQNISALWTVILGAVASFFGVADTAGIDWIRWILSIIAAIVAISIYLSVTGKKN